MAGLNLADGQVAASATAILAGTALPNGSQRITATFRNSSTTLTETLVVTQLIQGGTARQVARAVLAPNEQMILDGLGMDPGDTLKATTTDASTVDYVVRLGGSEGMRIITLDASGLPKSGSAASGALTPTSLTGTGGASTAAAGTTVANAGALPSGALFYPTTAADDTKGVVIAAADAVTGRVLFIMNGVSNKLIKVYGPSGAVINGAAADAAFSSASGKGVTAICLSGSGNTWLMS